MIKTAVTVIGGLMLPASFAVFMQRDAQWFSHHNTVSYAIYVVTFLICVCAVALWMTGSTKSDPVHSKVDINNSPVISPTISPVFAPVYNNYVTPVVPTATPSVDSQGNGPSVNIVVGNPTYVADSDRHLPDTESLDLVCLLAVENRISETLKTCSIQNVCASIRFSGDDGLHDFVQRAPWYRHLQNEISFPISSVEYVVLGRRVDGRWVFYQNPNQFKPRWTGRDHSQVLKEMDIRSLPLAAGPLVAEVTVFNRKTENIYVTQKVKIVIIAGDIVKTVRLNETPTV